MKLSFAEYKRKMLGCWMGKNIGGVLGAPFECKRGVFDVDFYVQDLKGNPPPNDDLDLQLVWLNAVERYGRQVDAKILGEYWLSFVIPSWVEYGSGKNNLRMGLLPPLSGHVENPYRDSCGCFIRSELWACLAPGRPELAARYAFEDAIVDHAGDGMHGEIFCAAVESAAFVESDPYRLIDIGLSYIPKGSGVATGVKAAIEAYRDGVDFKEARRRVLTAVPGTFGVQMTPLADIPDDVPVGKPGYDAPSNIGIMAIGWLYGEGDFGKSLCLANNCGEDTDCTCATLGSILGIVHGIDGIPAKWIEPIGDAISTCCINNLVGVIDIPKTVTDLADRVLRLTPSFLGREACDILAGPEGYVIETLEGEGLFCPKGDRYVVGINNTGKSPEPDIPELLERSPYAVSYRFPAFDALLDYRGDPYIRVGEPRRLRLVLTDSAVLGYHHQQWIDVRIVPPEGLRVLPGPECGLFLQPLYKSRSEIEFELVADFLRGPKVEILIDISSNGRHSNGIVKATLIPKL